MTFASLIPSSNIHCGLLIRSQRIDSGITNGMSYTVSMDKAGRIIFPKPVRQQLGIGSCATFQLDLILVKAA